MQYCYPCTTCDWTEGCMHVTVLFLGHRCSLLSRPFTLHSIWTYAKVIAFIFQCWCMHAFCWHKFYIVCIYFSMLTIIISQVFGPSLLSDCWVACKRIHITHFKCKAKCKKQVSWLQFIDCKFEKDTDCVCLLMLSATALCLQIFNGCWGGPALNYHSSLQRPF